MLAQSIRRFTASDLTDKAAWVIKRLCEQYPHKSEVWLANWLRIVADRNDCLFARTDHAVIFAEVVVLNLMDAQPVVFERFVWCEDRQNINHIDEAAALYKWMQGWARSMNADKILVHTSSDVPKERVKEVLGRLTAETALYARV